MRLRVLKRGLGDAGEAKLDNYWNGMFMVLAIAAVLDPRFKMKM